MSRPLFVFLVILMAIVLFKNGFSKNRDTAVDPNMTQTSEKK